jgi:hypothetical protein
MTLVNAAKRTFGSVVSFMYQRSIHCGSFVRSVMEMLAPELETSKPMAGGLLVPPEK